MRKEIAKKVSPSLANFKKGDLRHVKTSKSRKVHSTGSAAFASQKIFLNSIAGTIASIVGLSFTSFAFFDVTAIVLGITSFASMFPAMTLAAGGFSYEISHDSNKEWYEHSVEQQYLNSEVANILLDLKVKQPTTKELENPRRHYFGYQNPEMFPNEFNILKKPLYSKSLNPVGIIKPVKLAEALRYYESHDAYVLTTVTGSWWNMTAKDTLFLGDRGTFNQAMRKMRDGVK